jgi:phosphoribosylglycinamide formyltransferase-1
MALARISVLISGRGSNLGALVDAATRGAIDGAITQVISNRADARGLDIARAHGIATAVVDHRAHGERARFDDALGEALDAAEPDIVVLAGFMRVLGEAFVRRYEGRLVNIHPSLLPLYPGLDTHARALADGVRVHGCTVHFVTPTVDTGPIIAQGVVPVLPDDDVDRLAARVLAVEHRVFPAALAWLCRGDVALVDGRVRFRGVHPDARAALLSPPVSRT